MISYLFTRHCSQIGEGRQNNRAIDSPFDANAVTLLATSCAGAALSGSRRVWVEETRHGAPTAGSSNTHQGCPVAFWARLQF